MILELPRIVSDDLFFKQFIPEYLRLLLKNIEEGRKENIENYLKTTRDIKSKYNEIIDDVIDSLTIIIDNKKCVYSINTIKLLSSTNLNSIVSLINYGSLGLKGTNIFTESFDYIKDNLNNLYKEYKKG